LHASSTAVKLMCWEVSKTAFRGHCNVKQAHTSRCMSWMG